VTALTFLRGTVAGPSAKLDPGYEGVGRERKRAAGRRVKRHKNVHKEGFGFRTGEEGI